MLKPIYLPEHVEVEEHDANSATFMIHPYHPGYGPTIANALRRVLLSSLPGAAITQMKIEGIDHEFSAIEGVEEDLLSLLLNIKKIRLASTSEEPIEIRLQASGEKKVTAGDFKLPPEVTIANPEQVVATLTDSKAKLDLRCTVEQGRGYMPSEVQDEVVRPIGTVAVDAVFTPVMRVHFRVENVRVGQATDYHKLAMTITTNGTIAPHEALRQAASILTDHFQELTGDFKASLTADRPAEVEEPVAAEEPKEPENTLNLLQLPSRVHNALERVGITTVQQVLELTNEQIQDIPGLGAKAVDDIAAARDGFKSRADSSENTANSPA